MSETGARPPRGLVFAVATAPERRGIRSVPAIILQTGIGPLDVDHVAARLSEANATALVSIGACGGLAPAVGPGTLVVPASIVRADGSERRVASAWHAGACEALRPDFDVNTGALLTIDRILHTRAEKSRRHRDTDAVAVDMESGDLALAAERIDIPFLAARVVIDAAADAVPASAVAGVDRDGDPAPLGLLRALASRPTDIPGVLRFARRLRAANRTLARAAAVLVATAPGA